MDDDAGALELVSAMAGLSNKRVAARLYLSVATVEAQLSRACAKLGVRSLTQFAQRLGTPV